mmetsp:Transcript_44323/g.78394  ORF Transcript_44323/g.78394 Transcript_44323/m.78394 type:complete len:244 (-) Transcript_44323:744-1475(-)
MARPGEFPGAARTHPHESKDDTSTPLGRGVRRAATPLQVGSLGRAPAGPDRRRSPVRTAPGRTGSARTAARRCRLALPTARYSGAGTGGGRARRCSGGGDTGLPRLLHGLVQALLRLHRPGRLGGQARPVGGHRRQRASCPGDRPPAAAAVQLFPSTHIAAGRLRDRQGFLRLPPAGRGLDRPGRTGGPTGIAAGRTGAPCQAISDRGSACGLRHASTFISTIRAADRHERRIYFQPQKHLFR